MRKEDFFMDPVVFERTINAREVQERPIFWWEKCIDFVLGGCVWNADMKKEDEELLLIFNESVWE